MVNSIVAIPGWWSRVSDAERDARQLDAFADVVTACAHTVGSIVVVTVETPDEDLARRWDTQHRGGGYGDRSEAIWRHRRRIGGRLFAFPGDEALTGSLTVGDVVERTAIEQVVAAGQLTPLDAETTVAELACARPVYRGGRCQLVVHRSGGRIVPWEVAQQRV